MQPLTKGNVSLVSNDNDKGEVNVIATFDGGGGCNTINNEFLIKHNIQYKEISYNKYIAITGLNSAQKSNKFVLIKTYLNGHAIKVPYIVIESKNENVILGKPFLSYTKAFSDEYQNLIVFSKYNLLLQNNKYEYINNFTPMQYTRQSDQTKSNEVNNVKSDNDDFDNDFDSVCDIYKVETEKEIETNTEMFVLPDNSNINIPTYISREWQDNFKQMLSRNDESFYRKGDPLPVATGGVQFQLKVTGEFKDVQKPFLVNHQDEVSIKHHIEEGIKLGFLRKALPGEQISTTSACFIKREKGKQHGRLCVNYVPLNSITANNSYPLPRIDRLLTKLSDCKYISLIDAKAAYHSFKLPIDVQRLLSIVTTSGIYCPVRLPFGTKQAPGFFQSHIDSILEDFDFAYAYLDDILVFSNTLEEHLIHIEKVLQATKAKGLKISPSKCQLIPRELSILGWRIIGNGTDKMHKIPDPDKVKAIQEKKTPTSVRSVQRFCGMANFLAQAFPELSLIMRPLRDSIKNGQFRWSEEANDAFEATKKAISRNTLLNLYDPNKKTVIKVDSSKYGVGAMLGQYDDNQKLIPIAFYSSNFRNAQCHYSATDLEILGIHRCIQHWQLYIIPGFWSG